MAPGYRVCDRQWVMQCSPGDSLMIIATGVISANVAGATGPVEAGRMGPGEIMGEDRAPVWPAHCGAFDAAHAADHHHGKRQHDDFHPSRGPGPG